MTNTNSRRNRLIAVLLAVTSLFAKLGAPWDVLGFVGNIAGALMVSELGNSKPLDRVTLSKSIVSLMK